MNLSNDGLVTFHYRFYGTFFYTKIGSIISTGDLPTTNIIEPKKLDTIRFIAVRFTSFYPGIVFDKTFLFYLRIF